MKHSLPVILLASSMLAAPIALTGCVQNQQQQQQEQTVYNDIVLAYDGVSNSFNALTAQNPNLLDPVVVAGVQGDLNAGRALLAQLQQNANNPDAWVQVETDLNNALAVAASLPLPPTAQLVIDAALAILPEVESYINQQFHKQPAQTARRATPHRRMSVDEARQTLRQASHR